MQPLGIHFRPADSGTLRLLICSTVSKSEPICFHKPLETQTRQNALRFFLSILRNLQGSDFCGKAPEVPYTPPHEITELRQVP